MAHTFYKKPDWIYDSGAYWKMDKLVMDVLECYCRNMDKDHECWIGVKAIEKITGHWRKGIIQARNKLEGLGVLKLVGNKPGRGSPAKVYRVIFIAPKVEQLGVSHELTLKDG